MHSAKTDTGCISQQ